MRLIFIYGLPAVGKLTVAKELAAKTGYKLFHNHLVVDLLISTFELGASLSLSSVRRYGSRYLRRRRAVGWMA